MSARRLFVVGVGMDSDLGNAIGARWSCFNFVSPYMKDGILEFGFRSEEEAERGAALAALLGYDVRRTPP